MIEIHRACTAAEDLNNKGEIDVCPDEDKVELILLASRVMLLRCPQFLPCGPPVQYQSENAPIWGSDGINYPREYKDAHTIYIPGKMLGTWYVSSECNRLAPHYVCMHTKLNVLIKILKVHTPP